MSTDAAAVSIVVPTRNRARWLPRALDDVLAQDHPNLELLVVDDGSSDETAELLAGYAGRYPTSRFRAVSQKHSGQARAVNRGWEIARGEIVGYLADDDRLAPSAVARLVAALAAEPQASVAYPAYRVVDAGGDVVDTVMPIEYSSEAAVRLHDTVIGPGALIRRSAVERAGGWDPSLLWMGDLILWARLGLEGPGVRVPEVLASWTRHDAALTLQRSRKHALEHLRVAGIGLALLPGPSPALRAEAIRNACVHAALFAGGGWPGRRFTVVDVHRPLISGTAAGNRALPPGAAGAELVSLWRRVAGEIGPPAGGLGSDAALDRLRDPGLDELPEGELQVVLLEAAVDCGADVDLDAARFLVYDADTGSRPPAEIAAFAGRTLLGIPVRPEELREALGRASAART